MDDEAHSTQEEPKSRAGQSSVRVF
ncbi:hypothetical protein CCACVL1_20335 [Corchorus capsularis]|uniref:Uncharacterized protein n=1 Tax=Corchorus capsularis TaxID=210143 RepID=A0A1R3HBQ6_COCAP|nr:hypothetical protein CCACVL1_20335 [Corchorus capsularis]